MIWLLALPACVLWYFLGYGIETFIYEHTSIDVKPNRFLAWVETALVYGPIGVVQKVWIDVLDRG